MIEYFNLFSENLEKFRITRNETEVFDQQVVDSIENFIPARNELVEAFSVIAQYDQSTTTVPAIHKFFESLIHYLDKPEGTNSYQEWDWDNFKFIIQESFILCIAIFLKHERFDIVSYLLNQRYYMDNNYSHNAMSSFGVFRNYLESLNHRNNRLQLQRLSVHADMMKERCSDSGLAFNYIMQADFMLYLAEAMHGLKGERRQEWWPESLLYKSFRSGGGFEIFLRAESMDYFNRLAPILGVKNKAGLEPLINGINDNTIYTPKWGFERISPIELMNYEKLCSRA